LFLLLFKKNKPSELNESFE